MLSPTEAAAQNHPSLLGHQTVTGLGAPTAALRDPRTGLATAELLLDRLDHAFTWRTTPPLALLALTPLQPPASARAWEASPALIRRVSRILTDSLRNADTPAHAGNGLFLVLLFEIRSALDAARVAQRLIDAIPSGAVCAGIAVTTACAPESSAVRLFDDAMAALHTAREHGGSHFHLLPPHDHPTAMTTPGTA